MSPAPVPYARGERRNGEVRTVPQDVKVHYRDAELPGGLTVLLHPRDQRLDVIYSSTATGAEISAAMRQLYPALEATCFALCAVA